MALTTKEYYVYNLIDPRNGSVFYVGKGTGNRANQHQQCVIRNREKYSRTEKEKLICEILDSGLSVKVVITDRFSNERDAIYEEELQIMHFGIDNLTNKVRKGCPSSNRDESYRAGRLYADAMCRVPDSRVRTKIGDKFGISAKTIHDDLSEILSIVRMGPFVNGISDAIERKFSGMHSLLGGNYG